ncbi:zinc-dependent alcohol dehydrogenase family protein [Paenibacillus sp. MSJ-34]|uniref:zinc-dependent alcohol dehydrogenase family protein n=1 Tax=Paenibacillus sp. MSJ-34 TaxID=2841529 RepID=UPI001C11C03A|nr:zinc-dependent alcohol dehydrogenase family protein [Paenibacillus sp. MSJ-34]MBU5445101.1 zinc-dependent alcohol dehydrogenase family protein [Paenibacillus sp. MSJ-34]
MESEAKCIRFYEFGAPQHVLRVESRKIENPKPGEVLVRMLARPINPSDLIPITGAYAHRISLPAIPGYEGVGMIEEVGPCVPKELIGKRVLPLRGEGTWQEYVKASSDWIVPIPDAIDDDTAAQLYINPVTAWLACTEVLQIRPNDVVLVNACGSSIGRIFAQLSKMIGYRLIAVTRNHSYTEELLQLGASHVINITETPLHQTVMELTNGHGATAAIDSVGASSGTELAFCLRPGGMLLVIGLLSGTPVNWADIAKQAKANIRMFHLRHWNGHVSVQTWQETFRHLVSLIISGKLKLTIPASHYDLQEVHDAVCYAQVSKRNPGKILLTN